MASRYDIHSNRGYDTNRAIREYRATRKREKDPNRPLTLFEQLGIEQDSDTDRLDALERIESQYGDPAYPLRGQVTRKTQEQAEYMRNFLRGATESAVAGETSMADKVIGLTEAGNFNFDAAKNLENPQNSLEVINTTDYGLSPDMAEGSDDNTIEGSGPVDTSALREPAGYRLAAEGLDATDFGLSPDRDSIGPIPVTTESLPRLSVPGAPTVDQMTGRSLLRRALEASRNPIDMQRFEELAQDRKRDGGLSMITSLAAGEAGPRYADYKENYLKKAMAEKGEKQLGDYGFASGGQFYETPGIQEAREAETDMAGAELLFDAEEADARRLNKTLTANQYSKLMAEADTDQIALDQLDQVLSTFEVLEGGADRGFTVWTDQVTANAKNFFGKQASRDEFRLMSRDAKLQQIIGLFRTEIVGPGIVTEYDAERILKSVGGNVGAFQNPDIVREQLDILRRQKLKALATKKRQLDYFGRAYPGLYGSVAAPSSLSLGANDAGAGQEIFESDF